MFHIEWPPWKWSWFTGFNILQRSSLKYCLRFHSRRLSDIIQQEIKEFRQLGRKSVKVTKIMEDYIREVEELRIPMDDLVCPGEPRGDDHMEIIMERKRIPAQGTVKGENDE